MHIYEGILSATPQGQILLIGGAVAAAAGTAIGLRTLTPQRIPQAALLSAAFFVVSLIPVPLGPTAVHLVLIGPMGLLLGWAVFPAVLVALVLQAVFFSCGGPTALGVNTLIMALPGVACYYLFRRPAAAAQEGKVFWAGFLAGAVGLVFGALLSAGILMAAGREFQAIGQLSLLVHLPVAVVEGLVGGSLIVLLRKVRPDLLDAPPLPLAAEEVSKEGHS
ncbi:MAG: cobalt transporter CbiM [Pirellulales bacterium]|nr:cobalt transporter CbiM [Pirellulales bacterium]